MSKNRLFAAGFASALLGCGAGAGSGEEDAYKPDEEAQTSGAETSVPAYGEQGSGTAPAERGREQGSSSEGGLTPPSDPALPFN